MSARSDGRARRADIGRTGSTRASTALLLVASLFAAPIGAQTGRI